ncbi:hypothetical protein U1Q18_026931 [Sarracenia purpurea var. burkii]
MESHFRIGGSPGTSKSSDRVRRESDLPVVSVSTAIDLSEGDQVVDSGAEAEHKEGNGGQVASGTKAIVPKTLSTRMADLSGLNPKRRRHIYGGSMLLRMRHIGRAGLRCLAQGSCAGQRKDRAARPKGGRAAWCKEGAAQPMGLRCSA